MNQTSSPSLRDLRRETEETRSNLTSTVEQLKTTVSETADDIRRRVSPEAIKNEVSSYVRNRSERLLNDITSAARRNPMQAVAVGASVAYPLLRLARDNAKSAVAGAVDRARGAVDAAVTGVRDTASGLTGKSEDIDSQAETLGARVSDRTDAVRETVSGFVGKATDDAKEWLSDTSASMRDAATSGKNAAVDAAQDLRRRTAHTSERIAKTAFQTIEENPLLVAGVGLLIGGLIASALPRSTIEDDLVGEASSAAKKRANEAVTETFERAKGAAGEVLEKVARSAGAEGLSVGGLGEAAKDMGQRMKRVAEAAVTTAFDPESTKPSTQGDHHG